MIFWFDTEFYEDGKTIELISIGVVAADGREYYAETPNAAVLAGSTAWLRENVLPSLRGAIATRDKIASDLIEFMGERPQIWAYYADYDWVALCQLYGTMMQLPKGWPHYCRDVKQLLDDAGIEPPPASCAPFYNENDEHHALQDARWAKAAWVNGVYHRNSRRRA